MLMSQPRQFHPHHHHMMGGGGGGGGGGQFSDTTLTKVFVGGLAWETQRDTMRKYFEQFGEILEAVVITDKATGRSKGYGFVTFKDPEAAFRACQNPAPVIDGRKANCNLASLGAQKNRPPAAATAAHQVGSGQGWFRAGAGPGLVAPPAAFAAASPYFQLQQSAPQQLTFPYSPYGYTGFSHDATMYPMSYYGVYGGQNLSPYYTSAGGGGGGGGSGAGGYFHNYYPYYAAYAASQGTQAQQQHGGYGVHQYHHPHMLQYSSYLPGQHQHSSGILSLPTSLALPPPPTSSGLVATATGGAGGGGGASSAVSEHNSSST